MEVRTELRQEGIRELRNSRLQACESFWHELEETSPNHIDSACSSPNSIVNEELNSNESAGGEACGSDAADPLVVQRAPECLGFRWSCCSTIRRGSYLSAVAR